MSDKTGVDYVEESHREMPRFGNEKDALAAQHGDAALAIIGGERVSLSDEDVSP